MRRVACPVESWALRVPALALCFLAGTCSASTGPITDPGEACAAVASAVCEKLNQCAVVELITLYGDLPTCEARLRLVCQPVLSTSDSRTTAANLGECAAKVRAGTCDIFFAHNLPPICNGVAGNLPEGAPCAVGAQCVSTYCKLAEGSACGTCARRASSGGACADETGCENMLACASQVCVPFGGVSSPCNPEHPCRRDLICRGGACAKPLEAGQPCEVLTQECDLPSGLYCPKSRICTQALGAKAGEACGLLASGDYAICTGGASCSDGPTPLCRAFAPDGAACDLKQGPFCMRPAICSGGLCKIADPGACK